MGAASVLKVYGFDLTEYNQHLSRSDETQIKSQISQNIINIALQCQMKTLIIAETWQRVEKLDL